jgi:RNA polymerase sigma-70 factor, ECF subfamily
MDPTTELQLVSRAQNGDSAALGLLYDAYIEKIYRFLFFRLHHKQVAEDLTSEVFFKLVDRMESFDPTKAKFSTWLYQIARNHYIDYLRSHKPTEDLERAMNLANTDDPAAHTQVTLEAAQVQTILQSLDPETRDIITMRLWDQLSYQEIAALTGKSEAALKMQFSRSINKLKQLIPT